MARILLVDDDESFRPMVEAMLTRLGHQAVTAANGDEAPAIFRTEAFDLAITDLMPRDIQLARRARPSAAGHGDNLDVAAPREFAERIQPFALRHEDGRGGRLKPCCRVTRQIEAVVAFSQRLRAANLLPAG